MKCPGLQLKNPNKIPWAKLKNHNEMLRDTIEKSQ